MKRYLYGLSLLLSFSTCLVAADGPVVIDLWPAGKVPGETAAKGTEGFKDKTKNLTEISKPTISVYLAPKEKNTGVAMLVAPGGGYSVLAWEHEGTQVMEWLNGLGINGILLKYRVPVGTQPRTVAAFAPHQDAQRAMSITRTKASEWGIDAKHIGMLGFSAGGHLTAMTITNFATRGYDAIDESDKASCRPDFAVLIYPGGAINKETEKLVENLKVTKETPPSFLVHATNDQSMNSIALYVDMKKAGVPVEMHLYSKGGHGFGMRKGDLPVNAWPKRCEEWLQSQGITKEVAAK